MTDKNYGRKLATKVQYRVFRKNTPNSLRYFVRKNKNKQQEVMIQKQNGAWFDGASYHMTLRDAIIYTVYGV